MTTFEMLLRVGTGVGLGAVIGFERQYRARMAGLRTNALVAVGATLFVLLSAHGFGGLSGSGDADPTRVAAQIVSGIGFLGAGVILRDGLNVRGLTALVIANPTTVTAESAWHRRSPIDRLLLVGLAMRQPRSGAPPPSDHWRAPGCTRWRWPGPPSSWR
ncbi:MgtC/SapB family protein [Amycolatopsis sp. NBC_00345]